VVRGIAPVQETSGVTVYDDLPFRLDPDRIGDGPPKPDEHGVRSYALTDTGWTGQWEAFSPVEEARREYSEEVEFWTDVVNRSDRWDGLPTYPYGVVVELIESGEVVRLCHVQRESDARRPPPGLDAHRRVIRQPEAPADSG
jgi:hypothetical protein